MPLLLRQWFLLVTVVAIAWAQTAGIHRGYLCDCGGAAELTMADHCHGPHTVNCHAEAACTEDHHDEQHPGDEREHPAVIDSLIGRQHQVVEITITAPESWLSGPVYWHTVPILRPVDVPSVVRSDTEWPPWRGGLSDWPHRLSQTIALRI